MTYDFRTPDKDFFISEYPDKSSQLRSITPKTNPSGSIKTAAPLTASQGHLQFSVDIKVKPYNPSVK